MNDRPGFHAMGHALLVALAFTLAAGCTAQRTPDGRRPAPGRGRIVAPVTYAGVIPCADCPGIRLTLTLFPDSTFRLRRVYEERAVVGHDAGRWSVEGQGTRLVLRVGSDSPERFQIVGADSLRPLDALGRPLPPPLNAVLVRASRVDPVRDTTGHAPPPSGATGRGADAGARSGRVTRSGAR